MTYNVVFEYQEDAGGYCGNRIWTSYESRQEFEESQKRKGKFSMKIVAEGVPEERAYQLIDEVPIEYKLASCFEEAMAGEEMDPAVLEMQVGNVMGTLSEEQRSKLRDEASTILVNAIIRFYGLKGNQILKQV